MELKRLKYLKLFRIVILISLIMRFYLAGQAFHVDILSNSGWGEWIYHNGLIGFYRNSLPWLYSTPTQLPMINIVYGFNSFLYRELNTFFVSITSFIAYHRIIPSKLLWLFNFVYWFGRVGYKNTSYNTGLLLTYKMIPIVTDILVASVVYKLISRLSPKSAFVMASVYLLFPFSWYISSLWGQYDQVSFLILLFSFLAVFRKYFILSPLLLMISIEMKPTSLIFIPLFVFLYLRQKPNIWNLSVGIIVSLYIFIISVQLMTSQNVFHFIQYELIRKVFLKSEMRIGGSALNFWEMVIGQRVLDQNTVLFILPTKFWGYIGYLLINILAFFVVRESSMKNYFKSLFIVGFGSILFLTNMLERYYFAGVVCGLIVSGIYKRVFIFGLILAIIFSFNLYLSWKYPSNLFILSYFIQNNLLDTVVRISSALNILVFIVFVWRLVEPTEIIKVSKTKFMTSRLKYKMLNLKVSHQI